MASGRAGGWVLPESAAADPAEHPALILYVKNYQNNRAGSRRGDMGDGGEDLYFLDGSQLMCFNLTYIR